MLLFLLAIGFIPQRAFAQAYSECSAGTTLSLIPSGSDFIEMWRTGNFTWVDLLDYALYLLCVMVNYAGYVAVLVVIIGGYQYIIGSLSDDKESGKKTIKNGLLGFTIVVMSWFIVDLVISIMNAA
jgi:hypothetical protein